MHFHAKRPYCWVERGIAEVSSRPAPVEHRGRRANQISDEAKEKRLKILRRYSSTRQRLQAAITNNKLGKVPHIIELFERLRKEIEPYGGVPRSWNGKV